MMKTKFIYLLLAFIAAIAFEACKTSEKTAKTEDILATNKIITKNDSLADSRNKTVVNQINIPDTNKIIPVDKNIVKNIAGENDQKDTVVDYEIINDPNLDPTPLKGYPIDTPLPGIFTGLFPDVKWELIYVNDEHEKMYRATLSDKKYTYDIINDFIQIYFKNGGLDDKKLVELCIFWVFHPEDNNMKIISTNYFENKVKSYYNYESLVTINNEQIEVYTLVIQNRIFGLKSYKNGSAYKTPMISH